MLHQSRTYSIPISPSLRNVNEDNTELTASESCRAWQIAADRQKKSDWWRHNINGEIIKSRIHSSRDQLPKPIRSMMQADGNVGVIVDLLTFKASPYKTLRWAYTACIIPFRSRFSLSRLSSMHRPPIHGRGTRADWVQWTWFESCRHTLDQPVIMSFASYNNVVVTMYCDDPERKNACCVSVDNKLVEAST